MKKIIICLFMTPIYLVLPIVVLFDQHSAKTHYFNDENGNAAYRMPDAKQSGGVREAWVRHYSSGLAPSFDVATDIAIDSSGNVYVTGYSSNIVSGDDYVTIKYDTRGNLIWIARYNGTANEDDLAAAVSVDANGNVYVSGTSVNSGTSSDFVTIKYNRDGIQEWEAHYNGPGNSKDEIAALAIDELGNVYVTGKSEGIGTWFDFATIKYNSAGEEQWVARYVGPSNYYDSATALSVSRSGSIYVAGWSLDTKSGSSNYVTIKYSPAGAEQWIAHYNESAKADGASAIAVDRYDNVYVTGWSEGNGTNLDYATIKYNSLGESQWVARYSTPKREEATSLTVDFVGNVYVSGYTAAIKYNSAGMQEWVIASPASAIALDNSGNIYVTDYEYRTVKYNSSGIAQWKVRYTAPNNRGARANALIVDITGNVYIVGVSRGSVTDSDEDFETVKYDRSGRQEWAVHYNGQGNSKDEATAMAVDEVGNVYVTGWSLTSNSGRDYLTVKYGASGKVRWVARYNGSGNSTEEATAIAVDKIDNVYVTGQSIGVSTGYDYVTIKYNNVGIEQWVARYNGPNTSYDGGKALVLDAAGNIYVTGGSTIKYDNMGVVQWIAQHENFVQATAIALDSLGNVYVRSSYGAAVMKFNDVGVKQWTMRTGQYLATGFVVDDSGNVYTTGWTELGHGFSQYITNKLNSAGVQQWIVREEVTSGDNMAAALTIDHTGNVYVTGRSQTFYATIKYNNVGVRQWVARYYGPANSLNQATALAVDNDSNVYVTGYSGYSNGFQPAFDYATIKYNTDGVEQWATRFNGRRNPFDHPNAIWVDGSGNVYVTGNSRYSEAVVGRDKSMYTTIKYIQNPVAVENDKKVTPKSYDLSQNYPNPFNPLTKIRYALPKANRVIFKIYNQLGHEMATLVNEIKAAGEYEAQWNAEGFPSGVYIFRLQAGEFVESKKLILLR